MGTLGSARALSCQGRVIVLEGFRGTAWLVEEMKKGYKAIHEMMHDKKSGVKRGNDMLSLSEGKRHHGEGTLQWLG